MFTLVASQYHSNRQVLTFWILMNVYCFSIVNALLLKETLRCNSQRGSLPASGKGKERCGAWWPLRWCLLSWQG